MERPEVEEQGEGANKVMEIMKISFRVKDENMEGLKACRGWRGVNRQQPFFTATQRLHKISACM